MLATANRTMAPTSQSNQRQPSARSAVPPFMVTEVDPVGAGDAFCAGVISGLLDELDFADAVRRGAALGAFCVSCQGDYAGLPTR